MPASVATAITLCAPSHDPQHAACLSSVRFVNSGGTVSGLTPNDLASIYGYASPTTQVATGAVVGIVVAYDYANAESDLAVYRANFGLPACTSASGCFTKIGAAGTTPATNVRPATGDRSAVAALPNSVTPHPVNSAAGWAAEADADIEAVSAVCPGCRIVLSEAATDSLSDLANATGAAVSAGATVVNASFGAPESQADLSYESAFEPAPVKVVAAAGDDGTGAMFPASATNVIAVAGTTINASGNTVTESLWSQTGGGCSSVFARTSFQPAWCAMRSIADTAVVADPNTGIAFYDSNLGGWEIIGGTSISAPIVAAMDALSGGASAGVGAKRLYGNANHFAPVNDSTHESGLGAPVGLKAFS